MCCACWVLLRWWLWLWGFLARENFTCSKGGFTGFYPVAPFKFFS